MKSNRKGLSRHFGSIVKGTGYVIMTNKKLPNLSYNKTLVNDVVIVAENERIRIQHMWLDVPTDKRKPGLISFSGLVSSYQRHNGSWDYTLTNLVVE